MTSRPSSGRDRPRLCRACRWRSRSSRRASTVEGIDAHPAARRRAERRLVADRRHLGRPPDRRARLRPAVVAPDDARHPRGRRHLRLRPDADHDHQGPGPRPGPVGRRAIRGHLRAGQLVILQSTTFPGTTTGPFREVLEQTGLIAGVDFDLAFAPERVNPGDPASASKDVPRLVGATTDAGHRARRRRSCGTSTSRS